MHRMIQSRVFCNVHSSHNCHTNSIWSPIKMLPSVRKVPRFAERVESSNASPASFHNRSRFFRCQTPNLTLKCLVETLSLHALSHTIITNANWKIVTPQSPHLAFHLPHFTYSAVGIIPSFFPHEGDMWMANGPSSHQRVPSLFIFQFVIHVHIAYQPCEVLWRKHLSFLWELVLVTCLLYQHRVPNSNKDLIEWSTLKVSSDCVRIL
jgi:hypothetical protein